MRTAWNSANEYKAREVMKKYCSFMPVEIYCQQEQKNQKYETIRPEEKLDKR